MFAPLKVFRAAAKAVARWHHRQHIKDLEYTIGYHERMLLALPGEIRRLHEIRRFHQGRVATLSENAPRVNWTAGRTRGWRRT
jgi:hypothetical protein